jgi:hypothetical protein
MTQQNPSLSMISSAAIVAAGILIAGSISIAAQTVNASNISRNKSVAIQGCYEVARGEKLTTGQNGDKDKNQWSVKEADINSKIVDDCLREKGY